MTTEQKKLFRQVLGANLDRFKAAALQNAEQFTQREGNRIRTDEETRELAVAFFTEQLADKLNDRMKATRMLVGC